MKIAICDDERLMLDRLFRDTASVVAVINEFADSEIVTFSSGEELLECFKTNSSPFDLILLDIKMDGMNGLDTAKEIRRHDTDVKIIFITSSPEYVFKGYEVNACRYILKTELDFNFKPTLKNVLADMSSRADKSFTFTIRSETISVPLKSIIYFESDKRLIIIHSTKGEYSFYEKMDVIAEKLSGDDFVRCHQSYLVNAGEIKECSSGRIVLQNGEELPVSKKYQKSTLDAFLWVNR